MMIKGLPCFYREDHHVHMKFVLKDAFKTRCYFMTYDEGFPLTGDSEVLFLSSNPAHISKNRSHWILNNRLNIVVL